MNKAIFKVVGTHALVNGLLVAGATVLVDAYKLAKNTGKAVAVEVVDS